TMALHVRFTVLAAATLPLDLVLWGVVLIARHRRATPASERTPRALGPAARLAILAAAAIACLHAGRLGGTLGIHTDSPDHIGTIRRMLATGDPFPRDAFFKDAGATGADPRKGFWHPQVALIARLAGADPVDTWRVLPACTAPIAVLSASSLGLLAGGPAA